MPTGQNHNAPFMQTQSPGVPNLSSPAQQFLGQAQQNQQQSPSFEQFMKDQGYFFGGAGAPTEGWHKPGNKGQFHQAIDKSLHPSMLAALKNQHGAQQPGMLNELAQAAFLDMENFQKAEDYKFLQGQENMKAFQNWFPGASQAIQDLGSRQAEQLGVDAGRIRDLGGMLQEAATGRADEMLSRFDQQHDQAIARMEKSLSGYQSLSNQLASSATAGMRRSFQLAITEMDQAVMSGAMSPEAAGQQRQALTAQMNQQIAAQTIQLKEAANQTKFQGGMQIGSAMAGLAQARAGVAGSAAQIDIGGRQQQIGAEIAAAQLEQTRFQVEMGAQLASTQFMMQGYQAMDQMIQNNPRGVVSVLAGLSQIWAAATSPGASQVGSVTGLT